MDAHKSAYKLGAIPDHLKAVERPSYVSGGTRQSRSFVARLIETAEQEVEFFDAKLKELAFESDPDLLEPSVSMKDAEQNEVRGRFERLLSEISELMEKCRDPDAEISPQGKQERIDALVRAEQKAISSQPVGQRLRLASMWYRAALEHLKQKKKGARQYSVGHRSRNKDYNLARSSSDGIHETHALGIRDDDTDEDTSFSPPALSPILFNVCGRLLNRIKADVVAQEMGFADGAAAVLPNLRFRL